jgi:hypothetical protein
MYANRVRYISHVKKAYMWHYFTILCPLCIFFVEMLIYSLAYSNTDLKGLKH